MCLHGVLACQRYLALLCFGPTLLVLMVLPAFALLQETCLAALAIAFQHSAFIKTPAILCAAACTCEALQQAVQQCSGCHMEVELPLSSKLERICSFSIWLPKKSHLLKSLSFPAPDPPPHMVDGLPWNLHYQAGLQLLLQSLQSAAVPPPPPAAAAGAACHNQQTQQTQQQQQQALRLQSFSSSCRCAPELLLAALPAHSLTQLHLDLGWPGARGAKHNKFIGPAAAAAIARLSNLQQLRLSNTDYGCSNPASCAAGVVHLSQLTLLDLATCEDVQWGCSHHELQALLPSLPQLRVLHLPRNYDNTVRWPALSFTHMTQLEVLRNYPPGEYIDLTSHTCSFLHSCGSLILGQ
jgi:hypothetical protein